MNYYLAPMEGITNYIYRRTYHQFFAPADKYFTPFINPHTTRSLNSKEKKDILPENNKGMYTVPQILTNQAEDFIRVAKALQEFGYDEVNLNLGCPSGTVVSKKKGAGFLEFPIRIDQFLNETFEVLEGTGMKVSVKTRLGMLEADEFDQLLQVYNRYPLHELIIHPRVRIDYYKNKVDLEAFETALKESKNTVCYNGDIFTKEDYDRFTKRFPSVENVMVGRGVIGNPGLIGELRGNEPMDKEKFRAFHDQLLAEYEALKIGDRNTLFKMKELWYYMIRSFSDAKKPEKVIKKAQTIEKYKEAVRTLLAGCEMI
ncbi:MAG: tRNA-dihydrouridine synthase family protein [Lachnospiraceae bacterium]|nr:tRNA-dihydrouridine synthase family protein [Lachnospiraceae bacterium]